MRTLETVAKNEGSRSHRKGPPCDCTTTSSTTPPRALTRRSPYKVPRKIEFLEALPRNASGKVLKKHLREPYWRGHQRRVGG